MIGYKVIQCSYIHTVYLNHYDSDRQSDVQNNCGHYTYMYICHTANTETLLVITYIYR